MLFPRYYRDVHILHSAPVAQSVEQIERTQPVVVMVRGVARGAVLESDWLLGSWSFQIALQLTELSKQTTGGESDR